MHVQLVHFGIFIELGIHHHSLVLELYYHLERKSLLISSHFSTLDP